jgi:fatty-acyl-CoA synthase
MSEIERSTIGNRLNRIAQARADQEALVHHQRGVRYTYRELMTHSGRLARGLLSLGLQRGDPVALWGPNRPEWVLAQVALARVGAVLTALDPGYGPEELRYALSLAGVKAVLTAEGPDGSYLGMLRTLAPDFFGEHPPGEKTLPALRSIITFSKTVSPLPSFRELAEWGERISPSQLRAREDSLEPEDPLMLLFTSGTTGKPKGVVLDHLGLLNKSLASTERMNITAEDRLCLFFPLFHMLGNTCICLSGLIRGAALVIPSDQFSPPEVVTALVEERLTAIYGSPSMFLAVMETPEFGRFQPGTLRTGIVGGAPCPLALMERIVAEMGVRELAIAYGITEASSWVTQTLPDDPLALRVSTIGKALPHGEVKIVDPLTGEDLPDGRPGEICTRGLLMKGYFQNPEATARVIDREGWYHTGDLGTRDAQSYFRITGRLKDVIVREGREILPTEVEDGVYLLPGVTLVQAFGVPHEVLGEKVAVWVKAKEGVALTEEAIRDHCRRQLAEALQPDYIRLVDDFPMTRSGKMQKFKMREMMVELLARNTQSQRKIETEKS